ncbi:DUF2934 domain-containing protein [Sphingomonas sp.]|uniref:DUF2934 domain-containing protein n=1 Tax=Sphingomonas sp. TaxID=28214 RepID=UPI0031DD7BE5
MVDNREEQLRQRAYGIWQDEGQPHGRDRDHWEMAERELTEGAVGDAPAKASSKPAPRRRKAKEVPEPVAETPAAEPAPKPKARKPRAAKTS